MARIEWVALRLDNWALWSMRRDGNGLGFSSSSALTRMSEGTSRYREAHIPVDEVDASITDQAVQALESAHPHLHAAVVARYLSGFSLVGVACALGKAPSTVSAQMDQADRFLATWFSDRAARRKALGARGRPP